MSYGISDNWANLLDASLKEAFIVGLQELPMVYQEIYTVLDSTRSSETDLAVAGLTAWSERDDEAPLILDNMEEAGTTLYTHKTFRHGFAVTKALMEDEQFAVFSQWARELGRGANMAIEREAAKTFNNAKSGGQSGHDGQQLGSDAHPLQRSATTCDNSFALGLTDANLKTAITTMQNNTLDEAGNKFYCQPNILLVPSDLEYTARGILESVQQAGTANNDVNVLKGALKVVVWPYLTDTNRWFLIDTRIAKLKFYWRVRPALEFMAMDSSTDMRVYRGRARWSYGFSDWRGVAVSEAS